ncbi:MAG: DNA-binding beta-propeller fold protein YncE [Chlamydiales bacterium]|jgi:DNA-binding beta-propeller fold protein YncE
MSGIWIMKSIAYFAILFLLVAPATAQELFCTDGSGASSKIGRCDLAGGYQMTLVSSGLTGADGIRVDVAGGKLYWAEQGGNIQRANLDGSDVEVIVAAGGNPHAVALDLTAGKVYWTELAAKRICRANLDGTDIELVIAANSADGLAVDPVGGKVYGSRGNAVRRANLNGTRNELVANASSPHGLALDIAAGKIYWTAIGSGRVQRVNMDGTGTIEDLVTGLSMPLDIGLDLLPGKMYWTELGGGGSLKRADLNGANVQTVLGAGVSAPFGVAVSPTLPPATMPALPLGGVIVMALLMLLAVALTLARNPGRAR